MVSKEKTDSECVSTTRDLDFTRKEHEKDVFI